MLKVLELNNENLFKHLNEYICEEDIYGILLKTGKWINAIDMIY